MAKLVFPPLNIPGVPGDKDWQLYGCKFYSQYVKAVEAIFAGACPFCPPDPKLNVILPQSSRLFWVWENTVAPLPFQDHQFMIVPKRHIEVGERLFDSEKIGLWRAVGALVSTYHITGYSLVVRSGDPVCNARSVEHLHFNMHVAAGTGKVNPTIGKSLDDLEIKRRILGVFETMRLRGLSATDPSAIKMALAPFQWELVRDRLVPPPKPKE